MKSVALPVSAIALFLSPPVALAQTPTQTPTQAPTLEELRSGATNRPERSLSDLQSGAAALEAERNSRDRNYTGNSADSPTIDAAATGGNDDAVARLLDLEEKVTVRLTNNTGAEVTYEVIGQTQPRTLTATEQIQLEALSVPTTLTAQRQNFGLVDMVASVAADGALEVSLEPSEFDTVQGALYIRPDGYVFVN